jgi:DHA2 family multidrug resistance protein
MESFPKEKQGMALGMFALGVVVAPVVGPTLGGYLTDAISWRWAFYINIPIGILAMFLQNKFLEDPPYIQQAKPGPFDKFGFFCLAAWCASLQLVCDKGQEDDWFSSPLIRWSLVLFIVALAGFLVREMTQKKPLLNLRVLKDRNFATGCFLIFMFGLAVYSITTILPLFFQTLMGYSASVAGLAVSPRGLGSIAGSLIAGRLAGKIDGRKLIALGFAILFGASLWTSSLNLQISPGSLLMPIIVTGFALPLVFVSLSGTALGTLPQKEMGNASGIYNLVRNLGGSIGIAAANTISQRHSQSHRNEMAHSLSGANVDLRQTLAHLTAKMHMHAGPAKAHLRSFALIDHSLNNQAQLLAYVDVFRDLAIVAAICVPLSFVLKKPRQKREAAA